MDIDNLIKESMLSKNEQRTAVLRLIKAKFMEFKTAKNAKPLDNAAEIAILTKMVREREESAELYIAGGRDGLAHNELMEAEIIREFLPKPVTEEELKHNIAIICTDIEPIKKNMGLIIKEVKRRFPQADGKIVSQLVQGFLN